MVPPALVKIVGQDSTNRLSIVAPRKMYGTFPVLARVPPRVKVLDTYSVSLREPSGATQSNCRVVGDLASFLWGRPWKDSRMVQPVHNRSGLRVYRRPCGHIDTPEEIQWSERDGTLCTARDMRLNTVTFRALAAPRRCPRYGGGDTPLQIRGQGVGLLCLMRDSMSFSTSDRVDASVDIYAVEEHFESMKPSKLDGVQHIVHTGVLLID
ncbi:hypothetical protein PSPO01_03444 [Paraphaeosphaeria sporulosa]